jgi:methionyl-tRNA synthetase
MSPAEHLIQSKDLKTHSYSIGKFNFNSKIEAAKVEELKQKYGGVQEGSATAKPEKTSKVFTTAAEIEDAVAAQGEKVRQLKSSGVEKSVWQPEVAILLDLKKQLTILQAGTNKQATSPAQAAQVGDADVVKALEQQIAKQAERVRELKAGGDKTVWQPEVEILLALKKKLTEKMGVPTPAPNVKSSSKSKKK